MNAITTIPILLTFTIKSVLSCNHFTEPDDYRTNFYNFMESLEVLTFDTSCPNLLSNNLKDTIWDYRKELYCKYMDQLIDCKCKKNENDFLNCLSKIRTEMKADVNEFQSKISQCNENFELLVPDWCGNV
nr:uncharacterized protein LOC111420265 [Onthophagus taurus]